MKPILHFKINLKNGHTDIPADVINHCADGIGYAFGEDYYCIFSPFDLTNPTGDTIIFNFDGIDYTYEEIINLIESK